MAFSAERGRAVVITALLALALSPALLRGQGDYQKGISYYQQKQFAKAIAEFEPIVSEQPDYEFGHRILGLSYLNTKQYDKAISAFQNALRLKSDNFTTQMGLALAYFNSRRFKEVLPTLDRAARYAKTPPEQYQLHQTRGAAAFNTGDWKEAVASLEKAVSLQRGNSEVVLQLGIAHFQLGNYEQALPFLQQAAAAQPDGEAKRFLQLLKYRRGVQLIERGQYQKAAEELSEYTQSNPEDPQGWFNLGLAYLFSKNTAAALEAFKRNLRLAPENAQGWDRLGYLYEIQKQYSQALDAYQKAFQFGSDPRAKESVERIRKRISQGQ